MNMVRVMIQLPQPLKAKLDALRSQGYTAAGFIRHVLERELTHPTVKGQKGRCKCLFHQNYKGILHFLK